MNRHLAGSRFDPASFITNFPPRRIFTIDQIDARYPARGGSGATGLDWSDRFSPRSKNRGEGAKRCSGVIFKSNFSWGSRARWRISAKGNYTKSVESRVYTRGGWNIKHQVSLLNDTFNRSNEFCGYF